MKLQTLAKTDSKKVMLVIYYVLLALTGIIPSQLLALLFLVISILLLPYEEFICLFPGALVYYSQFIVPVINLSFYRVYTMLLFLKLLYILIDAKLKIKTDIFLIFVPLFLHAVLSVCVANVRTGIFYVFDLIIMVCFFSIGIIREEQMKRVLSLFVIAFALSILSGVILGNYMDLSYELDDSWEYVKRFKGTFVDPNYCGFMYTFSIAYCLCLKPFKAWQRISLIAVLILGIIMTISFSSYISLAAMCFLYAVLYKKIKFKTIGIMIIVFMALIPLYIYGINNPDVPIVGDVLYRIQSYTSDTTMAESRSNIWKTVYAAFENQNIFKQLFGMNAHAPVLDLNAGVLIPAHNDYIEMLYNCGWILTIAFYFGVFGRAFAHYRKFRYNNDEMAGFVVLSKLLWLVFSFALSMISEKVFMPILFL